MTKDIMKLERGEIMFPLKVDNALIQGQVNIQESQHQEGTCIQILHRQMIVKKKIIRKHVLKTCTQDFQRKIQKKNKITLPPFTGEDDWKVWFNKFKTVAKRQHWTRGQKLDQLLPRLLGKAGDFVFGQLSQEEIDNYEVLVEELNKRFSTIETARSYKLLFNRRDQ